MTTTRHRMRYPELEMRYELHETLGSGGFAKVKAAVHKLTGEKVAVKIMNKENLGADLPRVYREIKCLKKLHHQHICQLFEVIETRHMIYVVIEFCPGGELFDYIVAKERLKEREARSFFRQILSALKYVHESGFIHRDLKPENLLLDEESNIKLIDFGLVAEPDDPQDLLATCCGSPAYAAPELIRGGPYIGTRADVWSLGVLLYALINGFLPFDDDHTPQLYRLIQKGDYEIPEWLSLQTISILAQLLQTNPERRITVDRLLSNKWVMTGYQAPVDWKTKIDMEELNVDCVAELARYHGYSEEAMEDELYKWKYNETTATYLLLLQQKQRGKQPRIMVPPKERVLTHSSSVGSVSPLILTLTISKDTSSSSTEAEKVGERGEEGEEGEGEGNEGFHTPPDTVPVERLEDHKEHDKEHSSPIPDMPASYPQQRRISVGQPIHPPDGELHSLQKHLAAFMSPEAKVAMQIGPPEEEGSPTPSFTYDRDSLFQSGAMSLPQNSCLLTPPAVGPKRSVPFPFSPSTDFTHSYSSRKATVKKTCSYDAQLNRVVQLERESIPDPCTPQPARKKRFGRIPGHLLKKAKRVFTPRSSRQNTSENPSGPRRIKGVYDVTSTSMKAPECVVSEVERVLSEMGIEFKRKNYVLHCKFNRLAIAQVDRKRKNVEFDLEVCFIPTLDMIGIRRKRIKGDTWEYKDICGQIFKATRL